ncbi:hypothetical protein [Microbacterium imperiale]|uniref:Uncharacterized protein n=1 Tax=Microbacterium imperiale TaxID=33884 RepID=A0A9W6HGF8_9MICO|nr:hypothetical protein [Microbacterium imperiale]MBP2422120.1 hypothetical protein [Microbacterium imperiale]MDS0200279.1 hypothetical protein [Microbacterium imperiale]BFE39442.1 hypothetical protein GCM10017544_03980 [Microbacterium imperiale]GLJ79691.1 hypothetical protein GCM10017586_13730 [Microbacterium imperiale]
MWETFWPDVLVAVIGAALGAVLTVLIAAITYVISVRRQELRSLNDLIDDLHHRRAFDTGPGLIPGARASEDYARANRSVISARNEIRQARRGVRFNAKLREPLKRMTQACNEYLDAAEWEPDAYALHVVELRAALMDDIRRIAAARRGVRALEPGGGASR